MPSLAFTVLLAIQTLGVLSHNHQTSGHIENPRDRERRSAQEGPSVEVPAGRTITLDGILDPQEWASASRHSFSGGEVLLQYEGELLSVGVRGSRAGFPHIALSAGDSVWVLHASAALGKVVYARDDQGWALSTSPVWEVRDPSLTPTAMAAREGYLQANHWVGTTGRMGRPGETEFLVRLSGFGGDKARFAVSHFAPDSVEETTRWPSGNPDDIGMLQLLTGPMPEHLSFTPNQWALLIVSKGGTAPSCQETG